MAQHGTGGETDARSGFGDDFLHTVGCYIDYGHIGLKMVAVWLPVGIYLVERKEVFAVADDALCRIGAGVFVRIGCEVDLSRFFHCLRVENPYGAE